MNKIKVLDSNLINKIAAGEVIERPSSVIKELIENCIDANATKITLHVEGDGQSLMRITDNGEGMGEEDLRTCIIRHATSKISDYQDLFNINTMGFRGEALAAVSSCSVLKISSKTEDMELGNELYIQGGQDLTIKPKAVPVGTCIEVRNLFFNTPARKKFMKGQQTEYKHILNMVTNICMSYPHIEFIFTHNNREVLNLRSQTFDQRIQQIVGENIYKHFVPVEYKSSNLVITGFIGKPSVSRRGNDHQYIFVNGRAVRIPLINRAMKDAYASLLEPAKNPMYVLNIWIDPNEVDCNIHPRKLEVKFRDTRLIFQAVSNAVKAATNKFTMIYNFDADPLPNQINKAFTPQSSNSQSTANNIKPPTQTSFGGSKEFKNTPSKNDIQKSISFSQQFQSQPQLENDLSFLNNITDAQKSDLENHPDLSQVKSSIVNDGEVEALPIPIGYLNSAYIICSAADGLYLIDQHSAHERIRFNQVVDEAPKEVTPQGLLIPLKINLSQSDSMLVKNHLDFFKEIGFDLNLKSETELEINTVPNYIIQSDIESIFIGLLGELNIQALEHGDLKELKHVQIEALEYVACRSAVKFGDHLSIEEQCKLIKDLFSTENKETCPHGRPTIVHFTYNELDKLFKRK